MHEKGIIAALGEPGPQEGMNRTLTALTLLLTLPLMLLLACRNPSNFKCDPFSGVDCDGGTDASFGGRVLELPCRAPSRGQERRSGSSSVEQYYADYRWWSQLAVLEFGIPWDGCRHELWFQLGQE